LRNNLSVAQPSHSAGIPIVNAQFGWILFGFNLAYTRLPVRALLRRLAGPPKSLTIFIAVRLGGLLTVFTGSHPGLLRPRPAEVLWSLAVRAVLLGAAQAPIFPIIAGTFRQLVSRCELGPAERLHQRGHLAAAASLRAAVTLLIIHFGWRESFYLLAPFGFAAAGLVGGGYARG